MTDEGWPPPEGIDPKRCPSRSRQTRKQCGLAAGWGTDHKGFGNCRKHLGNAEQYKRLAARAAIENTLRTLHIEDAVDPVEALLEALRVACWREAGLRSILLGRPDVADEKGRPDVALVMHADALELRAKIAAECVRAGIEERRVRLAERDADLLHDLLELALVTAGVDDDGRALAFGAVATRIRELRVPALPADSRN